MGGRLTPDVVVPGLLMGALCFVLLRRSLGDLPALLVVVVKVAVPVAYFSWSPVHWTFSDDVEYWSQGRQLLAAGYDPLSLLLRADGRLLLVFVAGGVHVLYIWWNLLAQWLFGPTYHAAVFLNLAAAAVAGVVLFRIAMGSGFTPSYARWLTVFFLLQWDSLAWSSIANLKDTLVLALTLVAFWCLLRLSSRGVARAAGSLAGLLAVFFCLAFLRFYVPLLVLTSFGTWTLMNQRGRRKYLLLAGAGAMVSVLAVRYAGFAAMLNLDPVAALAGIVRFALTPRPWSIEPEYGFLLVPTLLHWLFLLPAIAAAVALWRHHPVLRLLLIYLVGAVALYGMLPEMQGPRHRVQLTFVLAWMQFHAAYLFFTWVAPVRLPAAHPPAVPA